MTKRALVMSGGDLRFYWHLGALHRLAHHGYEPHMVYGTSAGALLTYAIATLRQRERLHLADVVRRIDGLTSEVNGPDDLVRKRSLLAMAWNRLTGRKWGGVLVMEGLHRLLGRLEDRPPAWLAPEVGAGVDQAVGGPYEVSVVELTTGETLRLPATRETAFASASVPVLTPLCAIGASASLTDGGVLEVTPLAPAIMAGADEITVLIASAPEVRPRAALDHPEQILLRVLELMTHQQIQRDVAECRRINQEVLAGRDKTHRLIRLRTVWVRSAIPEATIAKFTRDDVSALRSAGYVDCEAQWETPFV